MHPGSKFILNMKNSVESSTLLRARRWGNIANGVLLGTVGPIALIISAISLRLPHALLAGYITALGGTIAALELDFAPIAPWVAKHLSFLPRSPAAPRSSPSRAALPGPLEGQRHSQRSSRAYALL